MPFEYDANKSDLNQAKHGIDFNEAQELWDDEALLEIPAKDLDEPRFLVIGKIKNKHWSAGNHLSRRQYQEHFRAALKR